MFPPLRESPRDPALMRMQMEVPSSLEKHNKWVCHKSDTGRFLLTRAKPTEIMGLRFCCRAVDMNRARKFSFYDPRISLHDREVSLYDRTHINPPPPLLQKHCALVVLLNERSFSIMRRRLAGVS